MPRRIVFMGSPEFALPILGAIAANYTIAGVITQPDRPSGRGQKLMPPPVKILAEQLSLPLIQPRRLREPLAIDSLRAWQPDLIIVAAFGQILRSEVLSLPIYGCLNVHASLLPRWRGAAPIQAALLNGDEQTGITIMKMDEGIDTGEIISQRIETIQPDDTSGTLETRLAVLGADLLIETLPRYLNGELLPQPQNNALATLAPMLKKEDGLLDFNQPAAILERRVRAFQPWPGAFLYWQGQPLKILQAGVEINAAQVHGPFSPGELTRWNGLPAVRALDGLFVLKVVQPAGKRSMSGRDFLLGARTWGTEV